MEIHDYSSRRGALVPLLPKIHAMLKENASRDKLSVTEPPEHIISWRQKMRRTIVDINRRLLVALDGGSLAGIFFYRYDGANIYIEDVQTAWTYRKNPAVIEGFLKRLEYDAGTKTATFFVGERVKIEADKEMLAAKGFKEAHEGGWEKLGTLSQAAAAIKLRYGRA
ncbi:MAG: hypothetical protein FWB96_13475 [Defluviitaleaceae bacterium]|nr:hypothetical protein [Defluviitaleaceae bacterium]MCL2264331.1 hypothetical protein [Defluviitaleaceae bacterium]